MSVPKIPIPAAKIAEFCQRNQIQQLALFGSILRDDFQADSDVDVLVEFKPEAKVGMFALTDMQEELIALFQHPVDLVPKTGLKPVIRESVLNSTLVIYAV